MHASRSLSATTSRWKLKRLKTLLFTSWYVLAAVAAVPCWVVWLFCSLADVLEQVHAYDVCRSKIDFANCLQHACTEVRCRCCCRLFLERCERFVCVLCLLDGLYASCLWFRFVPRRWAESVVCCTKSCVEISNFTPDIRVVSSDELRCRCRWTPPVK
jgi:hypothetical protein